jgi:hypothetical protein
MQQPANFLMSNFFFFRVVRQVGLGKIYGETTTYFTSSGWKSGDNMPLLRQPVVQLSVLLVVLLFTCAAQAQASHWAASDDPVAKALIEMERKWAESGCTHNGIEANILADDFHGVSPDGAQYDKKQAVKESLSTKTSERECKLYEVKVHFFGDSMAILYGSETAIHPASGAQAARTVKLTWTDTWLMRNGKWQIVAAEDMPSEVK